MRLLKRLLRRRDKGEFILIEWSEYMNLNEALDAANKQALADKQEIATLKDQVAAAPDAAKAKALADTVLGGDSAAMPAPAA